MSWTEQDDYTLRNALRNHPELGDGALTDACGRAVDEIDRLRARVAELEATQTPEHIAAWKHWAKLEGAREEREAVLAWLRLSLEENEAELADLGPYPTLRPLLEGGVIEGRDLLESIELGAHREGDE